MEEELPRWRLVGCWGMLHPKGRKFHRDQTIPYRLTPQRGRQNLLWDSGKEADHFHVGQQQYRHFSSEVPGVPDCLEHTSVISKIIEDAKRNNGDLAVLWLNLTNAYGMIPHKLVETTLKTYHVHEQLKKLLQCYFNKFILVHNMQQYERNAYITKHELHELQTKCIYYMHFNCGNFTTN